MPSVRDRMQRTPWKGVPTSEPIGRGASPTRPLSPTRPYTHKYGRGAIAFSFAPLPQLSHAPDFFISCGACRNGRLGEASLPANLLVGAALRAVRSLRTRPLTPCRPHTHKYGRGAIGFSFAPLPQLSHAPDFSFPAAPAAAVTPEACPYQRTILVGARLRRVRMHRTPRRGVPTNSFPPKQKPAAFLPRGKLANNSLQQWNIGKVGI